MENKNWFMSIVGSLSIFFGYRFVDNEDYAKANSSEAESLVLLNKNSELRYQVTGLQTEVDTLKSKMVKVPFDIRIGDPTPQKVSQRKPYVAEVAGFHKKILHDKLMFMIHTIHLLQEDEANSEKQSDLLKGAIYFGRELDRWGDLMISETMSYQTPSDEKK